MRVQDGVCLLQEGRVQFVRARLDRWCSGRDLYFKGVQRACTVIQLGQEKNIYIRVLCECRAESVQCKVYPGASSVPEAEEKIRIDSRADIEVQEVSSGESSVALES